MYAREIYGLMMVGMMLLMAGCSTDDVVKETASAEGIAISFSCNYDNEEENITRAGQQGAMDTEDLYATGFGVMASVTAGNNPGDNKPDLMYNQEVKYTFVGDMENPLTGYWSYHPTKYWPASMERCYISGYAPYIEASDLTGLLADDTKTGIVGISANTEAPYIIYRRCKKPSDVVDLLWYYEKPEAIPQPSGKERGLLDMKMRHALTRLEVKMKVASLPENTKVLIEQITLTGTMTKTAKLILNKDDGTGDKHYPHWEALTPPDTEDRTILIDNDDNNDASYGIIDSQIRYIDGLPYAWQPAGLSTTAQNALSTGDRQGYIYLIPQDALNLSVTVKYHKMTSAGGDDEETTTVTPISINPFKGNKTYTLNLNLTLAPPTP